LQEVAAINSMFFVGVTPSFLIIRFIRLTLPLQAVLKAELDWSGADVTHGRMLCDASTQMIEVELEPVKTNIASCVL